MIWLPLPGSREANRLLIGLVSVCRVRQPCEASRGYSRLCHRFLRPRLRRRWSWLYPTRDFAMKLIIQIPCFNEAEHLPATLADLPREVPGIDCVEWLVIDDGSTDATDRVVDQVEHFSPLKKRLQRLGSAVVRRASGTGVPDTTSGLRAYNREAALQMQAVSKFTYTLETIIQAGKMLVAVDHVAIRTNPKTRESRLFPSMWAYVRRNMVSIFRVYALYEPLRVFLI